MTSTALLTKKSREMIIRAQFRWSRLRTLGFCAMCKRIVRKGIILVVGILLLPIAVVLYLCGFRNLLIFTDRIGHLAIEPDTLMKAQVLGLIQQKRWLVSAPANRVANSHLMKYWKSHFSVFSSSVSVFILSCLNVWPFMRYDVSRFVNNMSGGPQLAFHINKLWGTRPPVLALSDDDLEFSKQQLARLGVPEDAWFVCVHAREGGFSPVDEVLHAHRNGKIDNLIPAIEEITHRGGWVIRLGDPTMAPLKEMPQVIDYAHHPLKSARLDIILCARARFILGNTSGVFLIGTTFGVPSALANMIPMPTQGFLKQDLSIPKLIWDNDKDRLLTFREVMASPISTYRYASQYENSKITVVENSSDEILALTKEMMDRLDGKYVESTEDLQRQAEYMSLLRPQHYSYGAISSIASHFLSKHHNLIAGDVQRA